MRAVVGWFFVLYFAANAIASVAMVGKRRDPISPGVAAGLVVIYFLLGSAIYWLWRSA